MTDYISQFAELLRHEAAAINSTADRLDPSQIRKGVELVVSCEGEVILTGVGKSGFIARKIAATLTSTGTRALFLHPSDALHGDLGLVGRGSAFSTACRNQRHRLGCRGTGTAHAFQEKAGKPL